MGALFTFYSFRIRVVRVPDTQKQTWWWGVKLGQVGSWVMVLMPLSLPPTPLWHHWFKQGLPWNTESERTQDCRELSWCFMQGSVWRWRGADSPAVQQDGLFTRF